MNTPNNKRKRASQERIESVFVELLQTRDIGEITVTDICKRAACNRSTFYANYMDLYDLADKIKEKLIDALHEVYAEEHSKPYNSNDFGKLFSHIRENQLFYQTYFKMNFDADLEGAQFDTALAEQHYQNQYIDYHIAFFKAGLNAVIKKWLEGGCKESPEEIESIIQAEYRGKVG